MQTVLDGSVAVEDHTGAPNTDFDLEVFDNLADVEPIWRALLEGGQFRIFQHYDWVRLWYQHLGAKEGVAPKVVVVRRNGEPEMLFPLGLVRESGLGKLVWLAADWNDYNSPVFATSAAGIQSDAETLWREVCKAAGPADVLELAKQSPANGPSIVNPAFLLSDISEDNDAHVLRLLEDAQALKAKIHSAKTWRGFKRKHKKMCNDHGEVILGEEMDHETRKTVLRDMLVAKEAELRQSGKGNPFSDPDAIEFIVAVGEQCPEFVRLFTLRVADRVVVTTLCFQEQTNLLLYQTVYDRAFGVYSPGALLLHDIIFQAAREGMQTFDCSFGDDHYKRSICDMAIEIHRGIIGLTIPGRLYRLATDTKLRARRTIKANPKLYQAALAVNRKLTRTVQTPSA